MIAFLVKWIGVFVLIALAHSFLCSIGLGKYMFNILGSNVSAAGIISFVLFLMGAGVVAK